MRVPEAGQGLARAASPYTGRLAIALILILVVITMMFVATVRESQALPAFARKYQADCAMCHYPVVPRLNAFGQQYRRAGYRTPIEFNKDQDFTKVNEQFSGRIRPQFIYENKEGAIERSEFKFPELAFYYSGAVSRNFSAWVHATSSNSTNLDFHGHIQGVFGKPEHFLSVRVGQMHMLQQQGVGGFDSPTGISSTPVNKVALTRTGTPVTFNFNKRQKGIELAYIRGPGRLLLQVTNGLDDTGSGTRSTGDIDPDKDYLVAYEHLLDNIASGVTVFYYNGTTHGIASSSAIDQEFNFWRTGVNASKIFTVPELGFVELQGGYTRSHDNNPSGTAAGLSIDGNAFYVESQQYITGPEITFYERFSLIDVDLAKKNSTRKDYTIGVVTPLQTWLKVSAEYTFTDNRDTGKTDHLATLELQINY